MGKHSAHRTNPTDRDEEGTGAEQGLQEHSGLTDEAARRGEDTAAHVQDTATPPQRH